MNISSRFGGLIYDLGLYSTWSDIRTVFTLVAKFWRKFKKPFISIKTSRKIYCRSFSLNLTDSIMLLTISLLLVSPLILSVHGRTNLPPRTQVLRLPRIPFSSYFSYFWPSFSTVASTRGLCSFRKSD